MPLTTIQTHGIADAAVTEAKLATPVLSVTSTSYTLEASAMGSVIACDNASDITVTVPQNSVAAIDIGASVRLAQLGAGTVIVAEAGGVTVDTAGTDPETAGQYAVMTLVKVDTDDWLLTGGVEGTASTALPDGAFVQGPWSNSDEITATNATWQISDLSIPAGTEAIRFHLVGPGGDGAAANSSRGGGGGGGGGCIKTIYKAGGLDSFEFNIYLPAGGSETAATIACAALSVSMSAGGGSNASAYSGGSGGTASGGDVNRSGGDGGTTGNSDSYGGGGGGGAGSFYGDGGDGGSPTNIYGGGGGGGMAGAGGVNAGGSTIDGDNGGAGGSVSSALKIGTGTSAISSPGGGVGSEAGTFAIPGKGGLQSTITFGNPGAYGGGGSGGHGGPTANTGEGGDGGRFGSGGGGGSSGNTGAYGGDGGFGGGGGGGGENSGSGTGAAGVGGQAFVVVEWE